MGKHTDIKWREWGEAAFRESKESRKPVLLDLSAVWCHWCHVMDETSYSDDEIIKLINENMIPVRVDIDRRPDIRERYNFGGYPTTAFLDGDGQVIAGGTYIPPEQLKRTLMQVKSYFETSGDKPRKTKTPPGSVLAAPRGPLDMEVWDDVLGTILQQFDETYGGFGGAPKFPNPQAHDLALYHYKNSGNKYFLKVVEKSLSGMAGGALYDREEGGFFRYSVTRDWSEPHYEKMLEVNVGLLQNYLNAHAISGETWYKDVALGVLSFVEARLRDPQGGFYGSQDADEEYYKLSKLRRSTERVPYVDKTLYADLNGQAISAYLRASTVLGEKAYLQAALASLRVMEERLVLKDGSVIHYWDGKPGIPGLLADYVYLAKAFFDGYEHTGDASLLEVCRGLIDNMLGGMRGEMGILADRLPSEGDVGLLKEPQLPLVENSQAALILLKLKEVTGEASYGGAANEILTALSGQYARYSIFAAPYAVAVAALLRGPIRLDLVGKGEERQLKKVRQVLLTDFEPRRVLRHLKPGTKEFNEAKYPQEPAPAVYTCVGTQCSPPITGPDVLKGVQAFVAKFEAT